MPSEWLRQRKKDQFHRLAKRKGFRSRASFKLLQIAKRHPFIRQGDRVLDLGAAPGGWLQAARQLVGADGFVLGVDKEEISTLPYENVVTLQSDITQERFESQLSGLGYTLFDVIISDLAPDVSGVWEVDQVRQIDLARHALKIARSLLKPGGNMLVKAFQGADLREFQLEMKSSFKKLRTVKPQASRPESAEIYLLGQGFLGRVTQ